MRSDIDGFVDTRANPVKMEIRSINEKVKAHENTADFSCK
jgi:hypothetical protein